MKLSQSETQSLRRITEETRAKIEAHESGEQVQSERDIAELRAILEESEGILAEQ